MQNGLWVTFIITVLMLLLAAGYALYQNLKLQKQMRLKGNTEETSKRSLDMAIHDIHSTVETPPPVVPLSEKNPVRGTILPVHKEILYETQNIDAECFYYFKGARLLLVEDNRINQGIIKSVLQKSGMDLDIANNGEEALEILDRDEKGFDLILMDISMPVMDGIEATRHIRLDERFDQVPIVTFTAFAGGEEISQMFKAGSNAFLTKPLNINQLYTAFKIYIKQTYRDTDFKNLLKTEGLDISEGIRWAEGDEMRYKEKLLLFLHRYTPMYELIPKWIREERYDRLKAECFQLQSILEEIGAYEMKAVIDDMIKDFIYRNEHLLPRFIHIYPVNFKTLLNAIEQYLQEDGTTTGISDKTV
jgi:CheY-like chemotaxis protein